jgi:hypothetical protein
VVASSGLGGKLLNPVPATKVSSLPIAKGLATHIDEDIWLHKLRHHVLGLTHSVFFIFFFGVVLKEGGVTLEIGFM